MDGRTPIVIFAPTGQLTALDVVVQRQDGVHQGLGTRRAARCVHVDRYYLIDTLDDGVVVEHPPTGCAHAHGDDPLRLHHLVVDLAQDRRHLLGHPAGHDHQVGLTGRRAEDLHAVAGQVVVSGTCGHHLDGATGQAEGGRPTTPGPGPLDEILNAGCDEVVLEALKAVGQHVGDVTHAGNACHQAARSPPAI